MPNMPPRDKKTGARNRKPGNAGGTDLRARRVGKPKSINELMSARPILRNIAEKLPLQQSWADWLRAVVPPELAPHLVSAVPKPGELVVFADSPAWGVRLRYALSALGPQISSRDATILRTRVRIQMPDRAPR
jgi:hypothetical protein